MDNLHALLAQKIVFNAVIRPHAQLVLTHIILEINNVLVVQLIAYYVIKLHALNQSLVIMLYLYNRMFYNVQKDVIFVHQLDAQHAL